MEFHKLTITDAAGLLKSGAADSVGLTESALDRISAVESKVNSFICVDEKGARFQAREADRRRRAGENGPLLGVPVAVKDNICTLDVPTTCASKILGNFTAPYDATVVTALKEAGAVIIGKTNLDEFAMGSSTENSADKVTANPWDTARVPGGSSGGSAAAVAAGQAVCALGSDTGGSIRQPAAFCGVVGLKPTYGLVSRYGLVAFASSLDQIGPIAKSVSDAAALLSAIAGYDRSDSTSVARQAIDYGPALDEGVKGMRFGVIEEHIGPGVGDDIRAEVERAADLLKSMGAEVDTVALPTLAYGLPAYYIIAPAEASSNLARFDGVRYGFRAEGVSDMLDLYKKTRAEGFGPEVKRRIMLGTYALSAGYYEAYYGQAQKVRTLIINDFAGAFKKYDALISPTTPTTAFKIGAKTDDPIEMYLSDVMTIPANLAGLPAISIPTGLAKGLPVGLQITAGHFNETAVFRASAALERELGFKDSPRL